MSYLSHLKCRGCDTRYPADEPRGNECEAGDLLEARYDLARMAREVSREDIARGPASLWRYAPLLPAQRPQEAVTLGEGWTPLVPAPRLARALGCAELHVKDEGRNPSGTFKDRGASVASTRLRELGVRVVVHNSSGNAAGAWGLYAARAGLTCVNVVPTDVLPASAQQSVLSGAPTLMLDAPWQESGALVRRAAQANDWFNVSTLREPYRVEGKKTMGLEIAEQLGWSLPDVIVYPTGGGLGALAIYKAIEEMETLGWIPTGRRPRLVVTQYEGCAPIVRAFREGAERARTWERLDVPPGGLKSTTPPGDQRVLEIVRETGGTAIAVSTEAAMEAVAQAASLEGLFPCPESATAIAGLAEALSNGAVGRQESVVVLCTGSGLKSTSVLPQPRLQRVEHGQELNAELAGSPRQAVAR